MKKTGVWMGFDVITNPGCVLKPVKIQFWKEDQFKKQQPDEPFFYFTDALAGLSLVHLNPHLQNPFSSPGMNFSFCAEAWRTLEPHMALYEKSQLRVHALKEKTLKNNLNEKWDYKPITAQFERSFTEMLANAAQPGEFHIHALFPVLESIDYLETKMGSPLLYNFHLSFSKETRAKLFHLYSFLFHLRALVAMDHNARVVDSSHETVKVDSIMDYLSKAEFVTNDALLYLNLLNAENDIKPNTFQKMKKQFKSLAHNGFTLVESLPPSFMKSFHAEELEEALYLVQMDWLLGSDAGLLFKIREELYGLKEGYEKIFWPEIDHKTEVETGNLSVNCQISMSHLSPHTTAA